MQRWSFNLQIYFLNTRFKQIVDIRNGGEDVIQDRTIFEDAEIFAPNLHDMGLMSTRDFENYKALYDLMIGLIQAPDLLIYLRATVPTLVNQIQLRGREYEESIRLDYLKMLNERYELWISRYTDSNLLVFDVDNLDFQNNPEDLSKVIDKIDAHLHGLF
jgi:deoxyadenosine/deoxycytidine kinase